MGQLTQTISLVSSAVNITSTGLIDWSVWGSSASLSAYDWMSGGGHTFPNPTMVGPVPGIQNYTTSSRTISWTNGTNTGTGSSTNGIYNAGNTSGDGLQLILPADTNVRTAYLYIAGYNLPTAATLTCSISDSSASPITDSSTFTGASLTSIYGTIELVYQANSSGQSVTFQWYVNSTANNNVTLNGAAFYSSVAPATTVPIAWVKC